MKSNLLVTDVERKEKARWVMASCAKGDLKSWVIETLNKAAKHECECIAMAEFRKHLQIGTASTLVMHGFYTKSEVMEFFNNPDFSWADIPKFSRAMYKEVAAWIDNGEKQ